MVFSKKTSSHKLSNKQARFIALMCGGMALLILVAVFVGGGGKTFPIVSALVSPSSQTAGVFCSLFGGCGEGGFFLNVSPTSVPYGSAGTLSWSATDAGGNTFGGCSLVGGRFGGGYSVYGVGSVPTDAVTSPITYNFHCVGHGRGGSFDSYAPAVTIYPEAPAYPTLSLTASPNPINQGQNTNLYLSTTGGTGLSCLLGGGQFGGGVPVGTSGTIGPISPNPSTQYWYDCYDTYYNQWIAPVYATVNVTSDAPVQADFSASPSTVTVGQSATLLYYAQSSSPPTACHINGTGNIGTLVDVPTCTIAQNKSYTTPMYTTPGTYDYYFYYYRNGWVYVKPAYVTVTAAPLTCTNGSGLASSCTSCNSGYVLSGGNCVLAPTDICTDINGTQPTTPTGCQVPVPNPGSCVPTGYTYNGSACVVAPPTIGSFSASPTRVRKNTPTNITFSYLINNPPASCTISGPAGFSSVAFAPTSGVAGTIVSSVTLPQASNFMLTCGSVSAQTTINLIPATQEI